jgi:hypothetical protein
MQFGPDVITELVIPNNVPFLPGNDVIGIGTGIPAELAAYRVNPNSPYVQAAMVFYTSAYDPTKTTPQIKYYWIGIVTVEAYASFVPGSYLCLGTCMVTNATVSQVGIITTGFSVGGGPNNLEGTANPLGALSYFFTNHADNSTLEFGEFNTGGDPVLVTVSNDGLHAAGKYVLSGTPQGSGATIWNESVG